MSLERFWGPIKFERDTRRSQEYSRGIQGLSEGLRSNQGGS